MYKTPRVYPPPKWPVSGGALNSTHSFTRSGPLSWYSVIPPMLVCGVWLVNGVCVNASRFRNLYELHDGRKFAPTLAVPLFGTSTRMVGWGILGVTRCYVIVSQPPGSKVGPHSSVEVLVGKQKLGLGNDSGPPVGRAFHGTLQVGIVISSFDFVLSFVIFSNLMQGRPANKILRIIHIQSQPQRCHVFYKRYNLLPLDQLYTQQLLMFVFKCLYNNYLVPPVFHDFFTCNSQVHGYSTRMQSDLHIFVPKTSLKTNY